MYKCWVSKFVSTNETLTTYKMRTKLPLWLLPIFLIFILFSCSKNEDLNVIENLSSQTTDLNSLSNKKGITNGGLNHLKNLEASMLEEVFCYAPSLGRTIYFLVPTSRMQNFGYVNLQPSDVVSGGGGGTPMDLLLAQLNGPMPMASSDRIKNQCLKTTLDEVLHNTDVLNQMSQMLRNFGFNHNVKIIFEESYNLVGNDGKRRLGEFSGQRNDNTYIIKLDLNVLPSYSREVIVSTIYHEVIHAQLTYMLGGNESQQHERMSKDYFNIATNSLLNQFPGMTNFSAKALIFGGLKDSYYLRNKIPEEFNEITIKEMESIEYNYKTGRKNGKYCP